MRQRIAIVGGGVSGLVAAHLLHREHDVTVFEARKDVGGHVHTVEVEGRDGSSHAIDMGFIVYNEQAYPLFTALLRDLGVGSQRSDMSFGVRSDRSGVEYASRGVTALFAQPSNIVRPRFVAMVRDIFRFNREASRAMRNGAAALTLGEYVEEAGFSAAFADDFLVPMGSALWSAPRAKVLDIPASFFVRFFENHGMLAVNGQPGWRVVRGGSASYVRALVAPFRDRIRTSWPVRRVERGDADVAVDGESFDQVIFACHADQALAILARPSGAEENVLAAMPFEENDVVLHTDTSVLPRSRRAWASWNYHVRGDDEAPATVTYNMNRLQTLPTSTTYCVTLNATDRVAPDSILHRARLSHPVYTRAGVRARERHREISGVRRTHFCGGYWGFGFHEDGVRSAYAVARAFGVGR